MLKSIETEDITDAHGIPFQIFYGISGNDHGFWSIANARKVRPAAGEHAARNALYLEYRGRRQAGGLWRPPPSW